MIVTLILSTSVDQGRPECDSWSADNTQCLTVNIYLGQPRTHVLIPFSHHASPVSCCNVLLSQWIHLLKFYRIRYNDQGLWSHVTNLTNAIELWYKLMVFWLTSDALRPALVIDQTENATPPPPDAITPDEWDSPVSGRQFVGNNYIVIN